MFVAGMKLDNWVRCCEARPYLFSVSTPPPHLLEHPDGEGVQNSSHGPEDSSRGVR